MTIHQEYLAEEAALMRSKWPPYRLMSPHQASALFKIRYLEAYKNTIWRDSDREEAERAQPAAKLDIFTNNGHFTKMWRARQIADELGVRYENYLEFCFDFAARRGGRRKPPQPNQLGPNEKTAEVWTALFGKMWGEARLLAFQRMAVGERGRGCLEMGEGLDAVDFAGFDQRSDAAPSDAALDRECPAFCVSVIWSMLPERSKDDDDVERVAGRTAGGLQAA